MNPGEQPDDPLVEFRPAQPDGLDGRHEEEGDAQDFQRRSSARGREENGIKKSEEMKCLAFDLGVHQICSRITIIFLTPILIT